MTLPIDDGPTMFGLAVAHGATEAALGISRAMDLVNAGEWGSAAKEMRLAADAMGKVAAALEAEARRVEDANRVERVN